MQAGATLDWQIFEEQEWDDAIAIGLIAEPTAGDKSSTVAVDAWHGWRPRLAGAIAVMLVGILLGLAYPSWRAAGMDVSTLFAENPALVTETAGPEGDMPSRPVAEEAVGTQLTMVTKYFRFEVYQPDSVTIGALAASLDTRYHELRRTLGLVAPASSLTITVVPHRVATGWHRENDRLIIASPRYWFASEAPATAAVMTDLLLQPLAHLAITEALDEAPVLWQWNLVVDGLRLWLRSCPAAALDTPCAGRHPTAQQVEGTAPSHRLADLLFGDADWFYPAQQEGRVEAAASLIAYIAHTYGDEKVASLLYAFGQHKGWHTLAPELFGVPAADLEKCWQEYVKR